MIAWPAAVFALPFAFSFALPAGLSDSDHVVLGENVRFYGAEVPEEVRVGEPFILRLHFRVEEPLEDDVSVFVHVESQEGPCRINADRRPQSADEDGWLAHEVSVQLAPSEACGPQRLEVYTGLYHARTWERFEVRSEASLDDRIHAAYLELVDDEPSEEIQTIGPSTMRFQATIAAWRPFRWWTLALLVAIGFAAVVGRQFGSRDESNRRSGGDDLSEPPNRRTREDDDE